MSVFPRLAGRMAQARLPHRTVRLRITLLYGGLFLVSGALLLAVTYILVLRAVSPPGPGDVPSSSDVVTSPQDGQPAVPPLGGAEQGPGGQAQVQPGSALSEQLGRVMRELLVNSGIALALMSGVSIVLGWIVAGRILRPLRTITSTARDISATNLHRRLALDGPQDELKELGDTFDSLLERLEASFRAQRQFVANASHELRTPLARQRVLGQVALSDPGATAASLREAHERILVANAYQERLIEALLTLTRGHVGIEVREPFDLAQPTHEVVQTRQAEADYRGVQLRAAIYPALMAGHRNLTERLVANLVDNALKYNVPGGWVEVSSGIVDGQATLTVSNTGPLVHPDVIDELFQPFRRLDTTRAAKADGLGLGLSIVRAVADAHDATVDTTARPEGGLTISVTFPTVTSRIHLLASRTEQIPARHR
ncbi:sensor histidine kinase [Plantactinospora solaniradicis]|uniref:histidine kinase n=1 Tax=Plantactinospora solaniradicis TaxID=1723736 RepID=A0ABW1KEF7_9ACTN